MPQDTPAHFGLWPVGCWRSRSARGLRSRPTWGRRRGRSGSGSSFRRPRRSTSFRRRGSSFLGHATYGSWSACPSSSKVRLHGASPRLARSWHFGWSGTGLCRRNQPARWVTLDLATFFCDYRDLGTIDMGAPFLETGPPPVLVVPMQFGNSAAGHTYGIEMATNWSLTQKWRLTGNYSWFRYGQDRAHLGPQSVPSDAEGISPAHQVQFRSQLDIGRKLTLDTGIYFVSALTGIDVPGYLRTDAR